MEILAQVALSGFSVGAIYGLIAAGFSITYLATGRFNFGLGMWVMLGAMLSYSAIEVLGIQPLLALAGVAVICAILGLMSEWVSVWPFRNSDNDLWIVATLAVGLLLVDSAQLIWGTFPLDVAEYLDDRPWQIGTISVRSQQVLILVAFFAIAFSYELLLRFSTVGLVFRAVASDPKTSELMGIRPRKVEIAAYVASAAIAGVAGFLIVPIVGAEANIGTALGFKGFAVAIAGGLLAPRGALVMGLSYGLIEALITAYLLDSIKDILAFSLVIVILYLKPFGLFGPPQGEAR
ncbi:MAG: branched-chain amino acid ABC transporter permease [Planctomycetota bacterium]